MFGAGFSIPEISARRPGVSVDIGVAFQPPSDFGVNFDRGEMWSSAISTASWARLRDQGVGFVRMTGYWWNPESQALRDQYEPLVNLWDWNIRRIRRSTTTTRILFEQDNGTYDIPIGRTVQLSHAVQFGTFSLAARTDIVANQSAAQSGGARPRFWSHDTLDVQPDEVQWGGCLMNRLDGSTTTLRCTVPNGPGTLVNGSALKFAIPLTYDTFTLPARTDITMRTSGAVAGEANIVAADTFDLILAAPVADLGDVRVQLGLLDKSLFLPDGVTVRHPISTMVNRAQAAIAAGLGVWWAGSHSSLEYAVTRYGAATVLEMERLIHAHVAAQGFPSNLFVIQDQEEPIHILNFGFTTTPSEIIQQWDDYRTTLLEPSLANLRETFPAHTIAYGGVRYRGLRGAVEAFEKIGADDNVLCDVHVFAGSVDSYSRAFDGSSATDYTNTVTNIETIRANSGVEVAVGEHGLINLEATYKADRFEQFLTRTRANPDRTLICAWALKSIDDGSGAGNSVGRWSGSPRELYLNEEIEEVVKTLPRTTITLNSLGGSSFASGTPITVSGSFTGTAPTAIEFRVFDDGVAVGSWATLDAAPGASTFSGTITPAAGTGLTVQVRKANVPSYTVASTTFEVTASVALVGTAKFLFYSYPEVSIYPELADIEWLAAWDFRNPITYGGTLPSDGAAVTAAQCVGGYPYAALQDGATAVPTFRANAGGTGLHGLRFDAASQQKLLLGGLHSNFNAADQAPVLFAVARHKGTGSPQNLLGLNKGDSVSEVGLLYVSGGSNNYRMNGRQTTGVAAQVTLGINTTDSFCMVGSHGRASTTDRVNKLAFFRNGGALQQQTAATGEILSFTINALTVGSIGARRASNNWGNWFDGDLLAVGIGRLRTGVNVLGSADEGALMDFGKRTWGIA